MNLATAETTILTFHLFGVFLSKAGGQSHDKSYPIDRETFSLFKQGDHQAAEEIVSRCFEGMVAYFWAQLGCRDTAEDLAQECFLRLYQNRERIYDEARVLPWLYQTARRLVSEEKRRGEKNWNKVSLGDSEKHFFCDNTVKKAMEVDLGEKLAVVLQDLKEEEQQLITLRFFSDLKIKEIAQLLSMPQGSVGVKLGRALQQFEKALARRGFTKGDLI